MAGTPESDDARRWQPAAERIETAAQRKAREGFVTLPLTPAMRAALGSASTSSLTEGFLALAAVLFFIVALILLAKGAGGDRVLLILLLVAIPLSYVFTRRVRASQAAAANRLTTYDRYTGRCTITEKRVEDYEEDHWEYEIHLASPPAPPALRVLPLAGARRHKEWVGEGWVTVEIVGSGTKPEVVRILDVGDQVIYDPYDIPSRMAGSRS